MPSPVLCTCPAWHAPAGSSKHRLSVLSGHRVSSKPAPLHCPSVVSCADMPRESPGRPDTGALCFDFHIPTPHRQPPEHLALAEWLLNK